MDIIIEIIKEYGIYAGVAIYLIYSTRKDYSGACNRLNTVEDFCRTKLMDTVERTNGVIERNTDALAESAEQRKESANIMKKCEQRVNELKT